ncbi:MAG: hypothetical protein GKR99_14815 [Rhodobacteraceae bacterium]|nr:hypothetical protein [Paracoccaceae bacterium]
MKDVPANEAATPTTPAAHLDALFRPASVVFVGGSNLAAALRFHRDQGFAGQTFVVSPKYDAIEGFACTKSIKPCQPLWIWRLSASPGTPQSRSSPSCAIRGARRLSATPLVFLKPAMTIRRPG